MKPTTVATGATLALAGSVSARLTPSPSILTRGTTTSTTFLTARTPVMDPAPTSSTTTPIIIYPEILEIMNKIKSLFVTYHEKTVTEMATPTLPSIPGKRDTIASSSDVPADVTVTVVTTTTVSSAPDQTSIASSNTIPASTTAATDIASIQSANAEALQILRDERPVYSNEDVEAARLEGFCEKNDKTKNLCGNLKTQVASCVDEKNSCDETTLRNTLHRAVYQNVCETTEFMSPEYAMCARWYEEASRCHNKKGRPCAIGHVKYLLRQLRDLIGSEEIATTDSSAGSQETGTARE